MEQDGQYRSQLSPADHSRGMALTILTNNKTEELCQSEQDGGETSIGILDIPGIELFSRMLDTIQRPCLLHRPEGRTVTLQAWLLSGHSRRPTDLLHL